MANATGAPIPAGLLHSRFEAFASGNPKCPAIIAEGRTLTYGDLQALANQIGRWARRNGARPNALVAVVMEKGWEQVAGVLGILTSGAAYLPIDASVPRERLCYLLDHGQVSLVLTQSWHDERIEWPTGLKRLRVDQLDVLHPDGAVLESVQQPEDLAYVIYTSGSTGLPKGVAIDHRGAVNTVIDVNSRFAVRSGDRVLALSALNFDLSVYDIFGLLAAGGAIVMPKAGSERDPAHWLEIMRQHRVTMWNTVPALMQMLVDYVEAQSTELPECLRLVMMSGDWIPVRPPDRIRALRGGAAIVSLGGATEASIWSILYPVESATKGWKSIPYGRPMVNQSFHVLSDLLAPRPDWVPGQLHIGGLGLAKGYWRDVQRTNASFITHPGTGERLYRTGDLGRYLPDGSIEFLGREDFQVKIRGHRIELGEIETAISQHPEVGAAVVVAAGENRGHRRLVAYVVKSASPGLATNAIRDPRQRLEFKRRKIGLREIDGGPNVAFEVAAAGGARDQHIRRRSFRRYAADPTSVADIGRLLACLSPIDVDGAMFPKYRYASAGGSYPVQIYLHVKPGRVTGLPAGAYYYHPQQRCLARVADNQALDPAAFAHSRALFDASAFALFLVAQFDAIAPLYGAASRDFCLIEAGSICQLLETEAPANGIGLCQVGGVGFELLRPTFVLDKGHVYLHCLVGGGIDERMTSLEGVLEDADEYRRILELIGGGESGRAGAEASEHGMGAPTHGAPIELRDDAFAEGLKQFLRGKLPDYMVPASVVLLDAMPLSANGKVDRKALPVPGVPESSDGRSGARPGTDAERAIAAIWREILKVDDINLHDNFFELGGDSVLAIQIIARANRSGLHLSPADMFEHQTVAELAAVCGRGGGGASAAGSGIDVPATEATASPPGLDPEANEFGWSPDELRQIGGLIDKALGDG